MTKTDSYANHCVEADENIENETTQQVTPRAQPSIKLQESPMDQLSPDYWDRERLSHDLIERPTRFGDESPMKLMSLQSTCIESSQTVVPISKMLSERDNSLNQQIMTSQQNPSNSNSITARLLLQARMKFNQSGLQSQTTFPWPQWNYAAIKSSELIQPEFKTLNYGLADFSKLISSPKTSHTESTYPETPLNNGSSQFNFSNHLQSTATNNGKSSQDRLSVTDTLIALQEPQTIIFHAENKETLQTNQELIPSVGASPIAESLGDIVIASSEPPITSENETQIKLSSPPNALGLKNAKSGNKTEFQLQPMQFTYATTGNNNELIQQTNTSALHCPTKINQQNLSFPLIVRIDGLTVPGELDQSTVTDGTNGLIPDGLTQNVAINPGTLQLPAAQVVQPNTTLTLPTASIQPNCTESVSNFVKPTTSSVNGSVKTQKKTYGRSNKIIIQSNELIKMSTAPQVGSVIQTLPDNVVRIKPNQIFLTPTKSKSGEQSAPIHKASQPNQNRATSKATKRSAPIQLASQPKQTRQNPKTSKVVKRATQTLLKHPMRSEGNSNSIPATMTSLKRKNTEYFEPIVPSKVQKLEKPVQMTMTKIDTSLSLPGVSIDRNGSVGGVKKSAAVAGINFATSVKDSNDRSFSECLKLLARNDVDVFKIPGKPSNKVLEKYQKIFEQNNVQILRVNKH